MSGQTVTFSISPDNGTLSFLGGTSTGTTGDNGRAAKTLVLGNDASGSYTVTASVGSVSVSRTATVETPPLPPEEGEPPTRTLYRVESIPFHPGDTVTFFASVRQVREGAKRGVSGETVTFSLSPDDGTASLSTTSGTTDSNGEVRTTLTLSSSASGNYTVTATFGDGTSKSHGITVYNSSIPPSEFIISMVYSSLPINPGESMTFTCIVEKNASPVQGQTVTFSVSPNDGTVSLSTTSATSDSDGKARTTLSTGSNSSGSYTVTASLGSQSISGTATVETSPPQDDQQSISGTATVETSPPQDDSGEDQQESEEQPTPTTELDGISASHDSVRENDGQATTITLTVTLDKAATTDETITLTLVSPLVGKTAQRGEDFDAVLAETLTIAKGQRAGTAQLVLTPKDNTTAEGDKALAVQATSSSGHAALINIKIIDNDAADEPQARLTPDPSEVEFSADDPAWKTFTVHTNLDSVLVRANPSGSDPALEVAGGQQVPTRDYCPAEGNDRPTRGRRDGWSLHVKACQAGQTKILLIDYDTGAVVQQYEVKVEGTGVAATTALNPSYPNPFNSETVLSYTLPTASDIRLEVFTLSGQRVAVLHEGFQAAGYHTLSMDASALASGVYLYRLTTPEGRFTQKFTLLR